MLTSWEKVRAVQQMQRYVEEHLTEPITLVGLARSARYSPWHAARLFKEHTGKSPFEYIRLRRLSAAAERLSASPEKIIDVALDFVFDSHEGFTRAFSRQFGMSPRQFRRTRPAVPLFMPVQTFNQRQHPLRQEEGETMATPQSNYTVFVQVVDRPARKLILKRGRQAKDYFAYCEEVGCEVWGRLGEIEEALHEPMGLWLPETLRRPGTSTYAQGVEVPLGFTGQAPDGLEIVELPPCQMMLFQGPPFDDKDFERAISSLWDVIKDYRPETYGFAWDDEAAPRFQLEPLGYRGYIEGRPVRPLNPVSLAGPDPREE
jgi:AraC family transcriptional regulator